MSSSTTNEGLKRVVGICGLSLSIVNFTIGAGIFVLPAIVSLNMGAVGIIAYFFCGILMACVMLGFKQLVVLSSASVLLIYLAVILSTIKLRRKKQEVTEKSFRVPGGLIIPFIGIAGIGGLLMSLGKIEIFSAAVFISVILVFHLMTKGLEKKNSSGLVSNNG
jgi:amino acid transporter